MLAELAAPVVSRVKSFALVRPSRGFVVVHPRYRTWLAKLGLHDAEHFLSLRGVILSGHHDRHVVKVEIGGRTAYLKREHRVGRRVRRRNQRDGFGWVSRSVREAKMLEHLATHALPGPQWLAYGEDARGRAFLLVEDLAGCEELRSVKTRDRRDVIERLGTAIADLHRRGIRTPDLSAKHVFVRTHTGAVTIIDWPSATFGTLSINERVETLAQLDASLAEHLATPRERIRFLRTYLTDLKGLPPLAEWVERIQRRRAAVLQKASIRDQRCDPRLAAQQQLVWLADSEAVCVTPALSECWPRPAVTQPYYPERGEPVRDGERLHVKAPDGQPAMLLRWRTDAPLGRLLAWLRGQCWRSPAMQFTKQLVRSQRQGKTTPQLLAFGQRFTSPMTAESFVLVRDAC